MKKRSSARGKRNSPHATHILLADTVATAESGAGEARCWWEGGPELVKVISVLGITNAIENRHHRMNIEQVGRGLCKGEDAACGCELVFVAFVV